jgi:hypothetical protein
VGDRARAPCATPFKPTRRATPYVGSAGPGISRSTYQLPVEPSAIPLGSHNGTEQGWGLEPQPYLQFCFYVEWVTGGRCDLDRGILLW